jgi:hypothetical protein
MRTPSFGQRVRHLKRESTYMVLGRQKIQISPETLERLFQSHWRETRPGKVVSSSEAIVAVCEILEKLTFIIYCADEDDAKWARPESEFVDGRFEEIVPPLSSLPPSDWT